MAWYEFDDELAAMARSPMTPVNAAPASAVGDAMTDEEVARLANATALARWACPCCGGATVLSQRVGRHACLSGCNKRHDFSAGWWTGDGCPRADTPPTAMVRAVCGCGIAGLAADLPAPTELAPVAPACPRCHVPATGVESQCGNSKCDGYGTAVRWLKPKVEVVDPLAAMRARYAERLHEVNSPNEASHRHFQDAVFTTFRMTALHNYPPCIHESRGDKTICWRCRS